MSFQNNSMCIFVLSDFQRLDGRAANDYRQLDIQLGSQFGQCLVQLGNTKLVIVQDNPFSFRSNDS